MVSGLESDLFGCGLVSKWSVIWSRVYLGAWFLIATAQSLTKVNSRNSSWSAAVRTELTGVSTGRSRVNSSSKLEISVGFV